MAMVRSRDVEMLRTPGGMATGCLASLGRGAREILVLRQRQAPGGQNPPHMHDREEIMIQVAGTVTVTVDTQPVQLSAGDTLIVPPHAVHQVVNTGEAQAEWLLAAPAGLRFFSTAGEEIKPAFIV